MDRRLVGLALTAVLGCAATRVSERSGIPAAAQNELVSPPVEVARLRLRAMIRGDYSVVAQHTDPDELARTRAMFDSLLRVDSTNYLARRLFQLDSTAQLRRLSNVEFTAGLMRFQLGLRGAQEYFSAVRDVDIIGAIQQGPDSTHVVYRWRFPQDSLPLRSYQVVSLVRCPSGWCGQMAGDFRQLVELLKQPMIRVPDR